jgi:hypothetical protein
MESFNKIQSNWLSGVVYLIGQQLTAVVGTLKSKTSNGNSVCVTGPKGDFSEITVTVIVNIEPKQVYSYVRIKTDNYMIRDGVSIGLNEDPQVLATNVEKKANELFGFLSKNPDNYRI